MPEYISFNEAWKYVASFPSYWIWIGAFIVVLIAGLIAIEKVCEKMKQNPGPIKLGWVIVFAFLIMGAIFKNPSNIAQNTTKEQAARGVYIGW